MVPRYERRNEENRVAHKETTIKNTGIVIGMCAVVGVFLCAFDGIASTIRSTLFTVFG